MCALQHCMLYALYPVPQTTPFRANSSHPSACHHRPARRHLDNLMLAPDGRLFHIDFGYILGNDPKPFPPPMKLCREMIEAMGGQDSSYYVQFRMFSCEAYNILRKSADLILSLFHLMAGASIEAIRNNPENAMLKLQVWPGWCCSSSGRDFAASVVFRM
eukprot:GHRQ01020156.1.p2 GENE.GHRQ01020156.1~~GHRQ01020156.1.p2  ORF type:complete len:160 (+),score=58.95 GHRQ01020156.1:228-707(+)